MLVNLSDILNIAQAKKNAVGSFNTPNLESIMAVIGAAEERGVPVVLMHAQIHESICPLDRIGKIMVLCAKEASVPVCVHLDHGESLDYIEKALNIGFTSVMYDGSALSYEENAANTRIAVSLAHRIGASAEAELGTLGKRETGYQPSGTADGVPGQIYTDPSDAGRFVKETGIDALACSFGTAHGLYLTKPKLNLDILDEIKKRVSIPLVMHGGSGVSADDYHAVIRRGIRKINYYTYMAKAGGEGAAEILRENAGEPIYFHDVANRAIEAMKKNVKEALELFSEPQDSGL